MRLFPEYEGLSLLRLFGQHQSHSWSPSPLHPHCRQPHPHFIINYALLCPALMVFIKMFEFFVVFFEHRRHYTWIIRPCCRPSVYPLRLSSSTTSSPASPSLPQLLHLLQQVIYMGIFYPSFFCACEEAFSVVPTDNGVSGCAIYLAVPVLTTLVCAFILDAFSGLANLVHASP